MLVPHESPAPALLAPPESPAAPELVPPLEERVEPPRVAAAVATEATGVTTPPAAITPSNSLAVMVSPASVPSQWRDAGSDTLRPNQIDALPEVFMPEFRPRKPWRALLAVGGAACAGLVWLIASSIASAPVTLADVSSKGVLAAASQAPAALLPNVITPAPSIQPTATPAASSSPSLADSPKAAPPSAPDTTQVTVRVSPSDAVVFKYGERVGKGVVTVDLAPQTKTTLVVQLDGYKPRSVVLDGSDTSVNVVLSPVPTTRVKNEVAASGAAPSGLKSAPDNPY